MKKQTWLKGAALVVIAALALSGCSKKAEAQEGGSGGGSSGGSSRSSVRESPASDFSYGLTDDGRGIKITGYTGTGGAVVIPSRIEDMPVLEIGENAFYTKTTRGIRDSITSIVIPNSVEIIGRSAFESLKITSFVIPSSVKEIGRASFKGSAIASIVVPDSVVNIDGSAFSEMKELTTITLSNNIKLLPNWAVSDNPKLTSVNLPTSLESIGPQALRNCGELTNLIIPDSLTEVKFVTLGADGNYYTDNDNHAFKGCQKLPLRTRQRIESWGYTSGF